MLDQHNLRYRKDGANHVPVGLTPSVSNASNEPALYAVVTIGIDARLNIFASEYEGAGFMKRSGVKLKAFRIRFNPTKNLPIFKEMPTQLPNFGLQVPDEIIYHTDPYTIAYEVRAPGCAKEGQRSIFVEGASLMRIKLDQTS